MLLDADDSQLLLVDYQPRLLKALHQGEEAHARALLLAKVAQILGVRYKYGGNDLEDGVDCSGFVRAIYEQTLGMVLPRRAAEQARATQTISQDELKPGDLVFFNTMRTKFSHVGIYLGDNKFIHSPKPGEQVRIDDMRQAYWDRRFNGARRVKETGVDKALN